MLHIPSAFDGWFCDIVVMLVFNQLLCARKNNSLCNPISVTAKTALINFSLNCGFKKYFAKVMRLVNECHSQFLRTRRAFHMPVDYSAAFKQCSMYEKLLFLAKLKPTSLKHEVFVEE